MGSSPPWPPSIPPGPLLVPHRFGVGQATCFVTCHLGRGGQPCPKQPAAPPGQGEGGWRPPPAKPPPAEDPPWRALARRLLRRQLREDLGLLLAAGAPPGPHCYAPPPGGRLPVPGGLGGCPQDNVWPGATGRGLGPVSPPSRALRTERGPQSGLMGVPGPVLWEGLRSRVSGAI